MYSTATSYYHEQLTNVLQDFGHTFQDLGLPESLPEFTSLLQKGFVMEFLIVTIIKPILAIKVSIVNILEKRSFKYSDENSLC